MPINPQIPLGATMAQVASPLEIAQFVQQTRRQNEAADALAEDRRAQAQLRQAQFGEIATRQQQQADLTQQNRTLDDLMKTALTPDPTTGVAMFDTAKISQGLIDAGQGHRVGALMPTLEALHQSSATQAAEARKSIALALRGVQLAGNTPEAASVGLAYLVKNRALDPTAAQPVLDAIQADPSPEGINRLLTGFGGRLPEYQALMQGEAAKQTAAEKAAADLAKTQAETGKTQAEIGKITREAAQGPPKHLQSETMIVNGRPAPTVFDPATGRYSLGGVDVTDKVQPVPPRSTVNVTTGALPDLPTIAPDSAQAKIARDLAYGGLTFSQFTNLYPSRSGAGGAMKQAVYDYARQLNPNFDPAQFAAGYKLYTTPAIRNRLVAIDALDPLITKIETLSSQVGRTDSAGLNKLLLEAKVQFGNKSAANLNQLQTLLGEEVGNALGVGTGSDLKTRLGLDLVNPNLSPGAFADTMTQLRTVLQQRKQALLGQFGPYGQTPAPGDQTGGGGGGLTIVGDPFGDKKTPAAATKPKADPMGLR